MRRLSGPLFYGNSHITQSAMSQDELNAVIEILSNQIARVRGSLDTLIAGQARIIALLEDGDQKDVLQRLNQLEESYSQKRLDDIRSQSRDVMERLLREGR